MEVQGIVKMIGQHVQVSEKFATRDIVVTTNEQYPQHILIQFTQNNTALLDNVQIGQQVVISINLRGREYADKNTGQPRYFNTIQGWRIQVAGQQQQQGGYQGQGSAVNDFKQQQAQQYNNGGQQFQQPQQQFNQQGYQQPQQNYQQQTQYQGQQNANFNQQMQQQAYQQQAFNNQGQAQMGDDDLPF